MFDIYRRVMASAVTLLIVVSGWIGASFRFFPNTPQASSPAAPTPLVETTITVVDPFDYPLPPLSTADSHSSESTLTAIPRLPDGITTVEPFEVIEGATEPRHDLEPLPGMENALCGHWWRLALEVGWELDDLPVLDEIMWAETRCQHDLISPTRDYGLVQINRAAWQDFVEARGYTMDDLLDARIGLMFGLLVAEEAEALGWCRYQPWYRSGSWC